MKIQKQEINKRVAPLPPWDRRRTRWIKMCDRPSALNRLYKEPSMIRLSAVIDYLETILVEFPEMGDPGDTRNDFEPFAAHEMAYRLHEALTSR